MHKFYNMFDGYAIRSINIDQLLMTREKKIIQIPWRHKHFKYSLACLLACLHANASSVLFLTFFSSTYFTFIQIYSPIFVKLHSDSLDKLIRVWICATTLPMRNVILAL